MTFQHSTPWQQNENTGNFADLLDARALSKLKWRCRRGLLENDLFIAEFFTRYEAGLTVGHAQGLNILMDLADNDLLDLLLRRKDPQAGMDTQEVREVLAMLRPQVVHTA